MIPDYFSPVELPASARDAITSFVVNFDDIC